MPVPVVAAATDWGEEVRLLTLRAKRWASKLSAGEAAGLRFGDGPRVLGHDEGPWRVVDPRVSSEGDSDRRIGSATGELSRMLPACETGDPRAE